MSTPVPTAPSPRRRTLGIIGGGQLARMMVLPAKRLGFDVAVLDPTPGAPAAQLADHHVVGAFDDAEALRRVFAQLRTAARDDADDGSVP